MVGILGFHPERFTDITDGLSHTLMVGESTTRTDLPLPDVVGLFLRALFALRGNPPSSRFSWATTMPAPPREATGSTFLAAAVGEVRIPAD